MRDNPKESTKVVENAICYHCKKVVPRCDITVTGFHDGCGGTILYPGQTIEERRRQICEHAQQVENAIAESACFGWWLGR